MSAESKRAVTLFYCYAREDIKLLEELEKHLAPLKRQGYLSGWHDRQIEAGADWQQEIEHHLSESNLILILLSPDFIHSDACDEEMHRAMALHTAGRARVIPILLRPVLWEGTLLAQLEGLPENNQPVTIWPNQDQAWRQIAYRIANIVLKQLHQPPLQMQDWQAISSFTQQASSTPLQTSISDAPSGTYKPYSDNAAFAGGLQIDMRRFPMQPAFFRLQSDLKLGLTCIKELWNYESRDWVTGMYAADIDQDGDIEVLISSRDGRVCSLERDGRIRWENVVEDKEWITAVVACLPFAVQQTACVIASTRNGKIYILNQQGERLPPPGSNEYVPTSWFDVQQAIIQMQIDTSSPLTIVLATENNDVCSFDIANNQLRWQFSTENCIRAICTSDVNNDGYAETLIGTDNGQLYLLSSVGELLHTYKMDQAIFSLYVEDIDRDGQVEILVGTRTKKLFALTPDLEQKWAQVLSSRPLAIAVADVNGDRHSEVLIACDDLSLSILDNLGKLVWRQRLDKRYYSLNVLDLDFDGYFEILAVAGDSRVYALRIQLIKDLDKKIRRDYAALGKPDITTLQGLTGGQLDLLLGILGTTYNAPDKKLTLALAKTQMMDGYFAEALLSLLQLDQQHFQLLWQKDQIGYHQVLCLADLLGDNRREVVASSLDGGFSIFSARGRLLWSVKPSDGGQILNVQSGYLSSGRSEDLAFASDSGAIALMNPDGTRSVTPLPFPEATCFYLLAPTQQSSSEILLGTRSGQAYLYTNDFKTPARIFDLSAIGPVQYVYASEPDEDGKYHNPELLMSTSDNQLFAYTRGGNCLWSYLTHSRILALCAKDVDSDGCLELVIGTEDRTIHVLDDNGNLRWRYVLYHSVLSLETADLDGDGKREILAGCADGILYVFTSVGDLRWCSVTRDPIQVLRAGDIDCDGNLEIVIAGEGHMMVLRLINQKDLSTLLTECWGRLLSEHNPLDALLPLIKGNDPYLRAAGLAKLATLDPLPTETLDLLSASMDDAFTSVRKILPQALMYVYPADPARVRIMLITLFTDHIRDVRLEVIEHLELLARYDWNMVLSYLERALNSKEHSTRHAALRKISHLLENFASEIKSSQNTLGESLFRLLLVGTQDAASPSATSAWIKQEAGRVLADFLHLFEEELLPYLYRLFSNRIEFDVLQHTAYNLTFTTLQRTVISLLTLNFEFSQTNALALLGNTVENLRSMSKPYYVYSTELWLIYRELYKLFTLSSLEDLSSYDFPLKPEQFQTTTVSYPYALSFLRVGDQLNMIMRPLKTYLRRFDPNDRLSILLESINALEVFQRLLDREYDASPLPGAPQPSLPEFVIFKALIARWQELFHIERNDLRGHPEIICELLYHKLHLEEIVGIWLQISNSGRAPAFNVKVTLLSDQSFIAEHPSQSQPVEIDIILPNQDIKMEFLLKPLSDSVTLTFEIAYDDAEHESCTVVYQDLLSFIERPQEFVFIENPYSTGTPLRDSRMFYGREAPLAYLFDNLTLTTAQTVLVLYGQRRSGKTTLLNQLAHTDLRTQHISVIIDLQNLSYGLNLNKLLFRISHAIFKAMARKGLSVSGPSITDFMETSPSIDPLFSFELFLDKIELSLEDRKLILLLDEFEVLEEQVRRGNLQPEIFAYLRSLMQKRQYIHFLLAGTYQIEKLTRGYWSVFFNIALHYRLPSKISPKGAEDLITMPVASSLEYEPLVVRKIRLLTADQPYLIHLVCRALVDHCNQMQKNYVTINDVNQVMKEVLETSTVHFDWLWDRLEKAQQLLLLVIAVGSRDEGHFLGLDDIKAIYDHYHYPYQEDKVLYSLKVLWSEDVIEVNNENWLGRNYSSASYALANGLLRQWLRKERSLKNHDDDDSINVLAE